MFVLKMCTYIYILLRPIKTRCGCFSFFASFVPIVIHVLRMFRKLGLLLAYIICAHLIIITFFFGGGVFLSCPHTHSRPHPPPPTPSTHSFFLFFSHCGWTGGFLSGDCLKATLTALRRSACGLPSRHCGDDTIHTLCPPCMISHLALFQNSVDIYPLTCPELNEAGCRRDQLCRC